MIDSDVGDGGRGLARARRRTVTLAEEAGEGSVFTLTLPAA
ncbi:MAG: hypothetical protein ABIP93_07925 [Gemmatimonadaceae bacterium]